MKRRNNFFIFFLMILILICFLFFLTFRKNAGENVVKSKGKNVLKTETEKEKEKSDSNAKTMEKISDSMYQNFGRGGERFTKREVLYETEMDRIQLSGAKICKETGCDPYILTEYLSAFVKEQKIECSCGKILDYCYADLQEALRKIYIFIQMDDEKKSLATVIFEPATMESPAYYDVLPCQYSLEEIEEQAWYEKEVQ